MFYKDFLYIFVPRRRRDRVVKSCKNRETFHFSIPSTQASSSEGRTWKSVLSHCWPTPGAYLAKQVEQVHADLTQVEVFASNVIKIGDKRASLLMFLRAELTPLASSS